MREALRAHTVIHLEVEPEEAWRRATGKGRPLARDRGRFDQLHADRQGLYDSWRTPTCRRARGTPPAGRCPPWWRCARRAPRGWTPSGWCGLAPGRPSTRCSWGRGLIAAGFVWPRDGRRFVVTDENVARHHRLEAEHTVAVAAGEAAKTLDTAELVLRRLAQAGAERGDLVVAVGGGVVGDLAGLCAALYQRGMRHVQVPTSLVAQVDSAYGGKTGVDLPEGKNYAGVFHQPSAVVCDLSALATLPRRRAGRRIRRGGEDGADRRRSTVGPGAGTGERWTRRWCSAACGPSSPWWRRTSATRGGGRCSTWGIPWVTRSRAPPAIRRYRHGEAVGVGLLVALRLSGSEALRAEVAELLAARGLPATFDGDHARTRLWTSWTATRSAAAGAWASCSCSPRET